ncbi:arylsulfatase [Polymorphobacter glacialis]|uniref:Arylsulfatase n=1 Tax=Sandarakinorhabdus glacialis TaxID=1614636 RepID=A0A916ZII5_9SPHN|nr:arylsulfatase [Polymorphobacter glacialis]
MRGSLAVMALLLGSAASARPNIVVLVADDWGFSDVGAFGGEMATPNIDALAGAGVRFSNFHVAGSCAPTRAMLQTGAPSHRAGLGNMPETIPPEHRGRPGYETEMSDRVTTIAERLRPAGYRTYFTGKWHLGHVPANLPTGRGYDRALALSQSGADNFANKPNLLLYDKADWTEDGKPAVLPKEFYSSRLIVDRMIEYLDGGDRGRPFLASVNFLANHIPVQAADSDIAAYRGRYAGGWTRLRHERRAGAIARGVMPAGTAMVRMGSTPDWDGLKPEQRAQRARAMEAYAAMATAMDREIGRLVAHLKASGQYEDTIFVFLSDNGGEAIDPMAQAFTRLNAQYLYDTRPQEQGRPGSLTAIGAGFASAVSSPLRGYKFSASEGGLRVPMIVAWPGNPAVAKGIVAGGFAHVVDVVPTLLAATGVPLVGALAGHDLMPMLAGAAGVRGAAESLGYELSGNAVLFRGDLKLVRNLPPYGNGNWALYDIVRDPGETRDLAGAMPAAFAAMQAEYARWAKREGVLAMPGEYSAPAQIRANAIDDLLWPRLQPVLMWAAGGLGLVIGGVVAWRRRRAQSPGGGTKKPPA